MRFMSLLLIAILLNFSEFLSAELINQPVTNIYLLSEKDTEVDSQAIYGNIVEVVERWDDWTKIKTIDGVQGWIPSSHLTANSSYENSENLRPIKSLFAHIYRVTDTTPYPPLLTLPYGSKVKLDEVVDTGERWVQMELISGEKAWIQRGDLDFVPQPKTLEEIITFSKKFLGLPYTWGGTSSYGFDCSGFVQMLFREMGLQLPRNSRDQAQCPLFAPVEQEDLQPGDLVFFGQTRITHVGLYLGNDEFIHSGVAEWPMVMISNIKSGKYNFQTARRIDPLMISSYQIH
jgi:gamma-D-glutamyl-L-lysine dipeptidyl-peptidase